MTKTKSQVFDVRMSITPVVTSQKNECSICLCDFGAGNQAIVACLPCGHVFHEQCYRCYIRGSRNNRNARSQRKCCLCRQLVTSSGRIHLDLGEDLLHDDEFFQDALRGLAGTSEESIEVALASLEWMLLDEAFHDKLIRSSHYLAKVISIMRHHKSNRKLHSRFTEVMLRLCGATNMETKAVASGATAAPNVASIHPTVATIPSLHLPQKKTPPCSGTADPFTFASSNSAMEGSLTNDVITADRSPKPLAPMKSGQGQQVYFSMGVASTVLQARATQRKGLAPGKQRQSKKALRFSQTAFTHPDLEVPIDGEISAGSSVNVVRHEMNSEAKSAPQMTSARGSNRCPTDSKTSIGSDQMKPGVIWARSQDDMRQCGTSPRTNTLFAGNSELSETSTIHPTFASKKPASLVPTEFTQNPFVRIFNSVSDEQLGNRRASSESASIEPTAQALAEKHEAGLEVTQSYICISESVSYDQRNSQSVFSATSMKPRARVSTAFDDTGLMQRMSSPQRLERKSSLPIKSFSDLCSNLGSFQNQSASVSINDDQLKERADRAMKSIMQTLGSAVHVSQSTMQCPKSMSNVSSLDTLTSTNIAQEWACESKTQNS